MVATVCTQGIDALEELVRRDAQAALDGAQAWLARVGEREDPVLHRRLQLVRADVQSRRGETQASVRTMRDVIAWAEESGEPLLQARGHRLLSALFRRVGDPALALEHGVASVDLLPADVRPSLRADHVLGLADSLARCESFDAARQRYQEAQRLAAKDGDPHLQAVVANNLAYTEYEAGHAEKAVAAAEQLLQLADAHGLALNLADVDTVARAYMMVGRYAEAEVLLGAAVEDPDCGTRDYDCLATGLLTLAEIRRSTGASASAQETLDRCRALCDEHDLAGVAVEAVREQAEVYAAQQRFGEAFAKFKEFHEASSALNSAEREARARTLQAIFEATEARRDSERFRELSIRDPLTGLHNRRFVDERLGALLAHPVGYQPPVGVALLDLDHFKAVNDTFSHEVGDTVLQRVAGLLTAAASLLPGAVAARMGGEEFLLVLPGVDVLTATARLEELRGAIASAPWSDLTADVPVTVSIGWAMAPTDGTDRSNLLRRADENLYAAKRAGRNRVVRSD